MGLEDLKVFPLTAGLCTCFWTLFTIIALSLSFKSLHQGKYALELSWTTQKLGEVPVTKPGLYFVGLGNMLVEFPSTMQTMYFANIPKRHITDDTGAEIHSDMVEVYRPPMRARSADGIEMLVSISFQWLLEPESIIPLYRILGDQFFYDEFVRFARSAIIKACHMYAAELFFTSRLQITQTMMQYMQQEFNKPDEGLMVTISGLQLREVDLPDAFDQEIANTQEQMQEVAIAEAEREEQIIIKERETLVAQEEVNAALIHAQGEAGKILIENEAQVYQIKNFQTQQASANAKILLEFQNDTAPFDRLFQAMEIRAIDTHDVSTLLLKV
jgi:regulator of protease activity HflC (stomatin/prohibitin superfamily)